MYHNNDIGKVAHHGSGGATGVEFLEQVRPRFSVISCGEDNRYGHPAAELVERLEASESRIFYTMKSGAITVKIWKNKTKIYAMKDSL